MKSLFNIFCIALLGSILALEACTEPKKENPTSEGATTLVECNRNLTEAQVERHFNPPVAARNYAYPNIAVYTALEPFWPEYKSLSGQLNEMDIDIQPDSNKVYNQDLITFNSFTTVSLKLVYNDTIVSNYRKEQLDRYEEMLDAEVFENSMAYSTEVAEAILAWADSDMYKETRNFGEFAPDDQNGFWKPTSPDYMPAIEPHWSKIRPFVLDSANQFEPERPTEYNTAEDALFMRETMEVLEVVKNGDEDKRQIAQFWDCNPNISHHHGHMMYFLQKISPGGHWMHISLQTVEAENMNLMQAAKVMAGVSLTLHDAFVACWTEKYNSNYIRPETVIKEHIDKNWEPILQTPAFPEYPSGHSVASASAATFLTEAVGEPYHFIDSTEVPYGLPMREFNSFREASDEAAISRLYGGIHFMPAIENGVSMGNQVGELVLARVKFEN